MGSQACVSHTCRHLLRRILRFSFVSRYNVCVLHACLHRLRRLLRFPWYCVTMHAFHTYVCIYLDGFCVFLLGMVSQCMRFTRLFASIPTALAFSLVWCHNACVSNACLLRLKRLLRFPSYGVTMYSMFHTRVCIG